MLSAPDVRHPMPMMAISSGLESLKNNDNNDDDDNNNDDDNNRMITDLTQTKR